LRGSYRAARVDAIRRQVRDLAPELPRRDNERAAAVLAYLCSLQAWVSLQYESGLTPELAQDALLWAIALIETEITMHDKKRTTR